MLCVAAFPNYKVKAVLFDYPPCLSFTLFTMVDLKDDLEKPWENGGRSNRESPIACYQGAGTKRKNNYYHSSLRLYER